MSELRVSLDVDELSSVTHGHIPLKSQLIGEFGHPEHSSNASVDEARENLLQKNRRTRYNDMKLRLDQQDQTNASTPSVPSTVGTDVVAVPLEILPMVIHRGEGAEDNQTTGSEVPQTASTHLEGTTLEQDLGFLVQEFLEKPHMESMEDVGVDTGDTSERPKPTEESQEAELADLAEPAEPADSVQEVLEARDDVATPHTASPSMPGDGGDSVAQAPPPQPPQQPQPKPWRTPRPIANSLEEAFDFWDNIFDVLCDGKDDEECMEILERLASDLEQDSLSTAFSGIRAPETATSILRFRLGKRLGRELKHKNAHLGHMIEWKQSSQEECKLMGSRENCCLFGDIGQFFRKELKEGIIPQLMEKPHQAISVLTPLIMSGQAVSTHGTCLVHGKTCALKSCKRHTAGTSCRPFSARGCGLQTADIDMLYTLSWVALRRTLQESDVTQENVVRFPLTLLTQLLGDLYHIDSVVLDSACFGAPTARERQFVRLRHKQKIISETSPASRFALRFLRAVNYHWSEHFVSILYYVLNFVVLKYPMLVYQDEMSCFPVYSP